MKPPEVRFAQAEDGEDIVAPRCVVAYIDGAAAQSLLTDCRRRKGFHPG